MGWQFTAKAERRRGDAPPRGTDTYPRNTKRLIITAINTEYDMELAGEEEILIISDGTLRGIGDGITRRNKLVEEATSGLIEGGGSENHGQRMKENEVDRRRENGQLSGREERNLDDRERGTGQPEGKEDGGYS